MVLLSCSNSSSSTALLITSCAPCFPYSSPCFSFWWCTLVSFLTSITLFADPTGYDMMMMMNPCWCHKGCAHKIDSTLATQHVHHTQKGSCLLAKMRESDSAHTHTKHTLSGTSLATQMSANWLLIPLPVSYSNLSNGSPFYPFSHTHIYSLAAHIQSGEYCSTFFVPSYCFKDATCYIRATREHQRRINNSMDVIHYGLCSSICKHLAFLIVCGGDVGMHEPRQSTGRFPSIWQLVVSV